MKIYLFPFLHFLHRDIIYMTLPFTNYGFGAKNLYVSFSSTQNMCSNYDEGRNFTQKIWN
jgi:hypothetical protein